MREQKIINITEADGTELTFRIIQMPATKSERWINRAIAVLANTAADSNEANVQSLRQRLSSDNKLQELFKIFGTIDYAKIEPLYNELLECCEHIPDKNNLNFSTPCTQSNIDSIVGDVRTLYRLRLEALKVNFSFFQNGLNAQTQKSGPQITFKKRTKM